MNLALRSFDPKFNCIKVIALASSTYAMPMSLLRDDAGAAAAMIATVYYLSCAIFSAWAMAMFSYRYIIDHKS